MCFEGFALRVPTKFLKTFSWRILAASRAGWGGVRCHSWRVWIYGRSWNARFGTYSPFPWSLPPSTISTTAMLLNDVGGLVVDVVAFVVVVVNVGAAASAAPSCCWDLNRGDACRLISCSSRLGTELGEHCCVTLKRSSLTVSCSSSPWWQKQEIYFSVRQSNQFSFGRASGEKF